MRSPWLRQPKNGKTHAIFTAAKLSQLWCGRLLIEDDLILGPEMKIGPERASFHLDLATDRWSGESGAMST